MTTFTKNSQDARRAKASDPRCAKASAERQLDDIPTRVEELLEQYNGTLSRRTFLKGSGMLVVSFSAAAAAGPFATGASAQAAGPYPDPNFRQLDSWIIIHENNSATFYVCKTDCGQGTGTAFRQMMSDELDIAYDKTTCIMGSTDITVDQGGSGASDAIQTDGWPMRRVAARPGGFCWRWHPRGLPSLSISSPSARA